MTVASLIEDLTTSLGESKVAAPGHPEYDGLLKRWADSAARQAGVVVCPTSNLDVSKALTLATKHKVPLTTCGGGHSTGGEASSEGGLVIDLRRIKSVTVSPEDKTIACGGGCRWRDVDAALAEHGLAAVGGTVNDTGVAGLTLGGGYGWLTGQLGAVIDNLVAAEVVLADGRIVTCSATSEPDLFWAVRGAGHSFGVATQFVLRAVDKTTPVYGGLVVFPPLPAVVAHLVNFANATTAKEDPRTALQLGFATMPGAPPQRVAVCCGFHDGPAAAAEAVFAPLLHDGPVPPVLNTLHPMPYVEMNAQLAAAAAPGGRRTTKGATFQLPLAPATLQGALDRFNALAAEVPDAELGGVCLFEFYPHRKMCAVPHAATAFPNRGARQNVMLSPKWAGAAFDGRVREWSRETIDWLQSRSDLPGEAYVNYDSNVDNAPEMFGSNYPRLRELKARYDPHNVFAKKHGLGKDLQAQPTLAAKAFDADEPTSPISDKSVTVGVTELKIRS